MKINQFLNKKQLLIFYHKRSQKRLLQRYNKLGFGDQVDRRVELIPSISLILVPDILQVLVEV